MISENKVTEISVLADGFIKFFDNLVEKCTLNDKTNSKINYHKSYSIAYKLLRQSGYFKSYFTVSDSFRGNLSRNPSDTP